MTLLLAMILDAAAGEPKWLWSRLPHPAVLMGRLIGWADHTWNQGDHRQRRGAFLVLGLVVGAGLLGAALSLLGPVIEVLVIAVLLAQKSLVQHVAAVADALRLSLGDGRRSVAMIVGRDTNGMDAPAVSRAAIESAAENLSDGVVAPIFWTALAGLPGLLIYKMINTADSMIGYKTLRHQDFGWAAARLDDLLNWVPARLTAVLIQLPTALQGHQIVNRDARLHRSPNAGWPEAAMAVRLHVALSGPRSYDGETRDFPWVHGAGDRSPGPPQIDAAIGILWQVWGIIALLTGCAALLA